MTEERMSLYFKGGGSDKEYHVQLVARDGAFMVLAQNGKRGDTLTPRNKTPAPCDYAVAKKAYDKVVKTKLSEGYSTGESGAAFVGGELEARLSGVQLQLLNAITEEEAQVLLDDDAWVLQEKEDGNRRALQRNKTHGKVGINRKGLTTAALPELLVKALDELGEGDLVLDGELVGGVLAVFDVLEYGGKDLRNESYEKRLAVLDEVKAALRASGTPAMYVVYTARGTAAKRKLYEELKERPAEGGVFKRLSAPHMAGRPNSGGDQLKRKFTYTASFIVKSVHATKRSVSLQIFNAKGELESVGNCTIPSNYNIPTKGAVVEVGYLYAFVGGSVFQPQYRGERDDIEPSECTTSQLQYKPVTSAEDDDATDA